MTCSRLIAAALLAATLSACSGGGGGGSIPERVPPTAQPEAPASGAVNVSPTVVIQVRFSEAMDCGTVNGASLLVSGPGGTLAGQVSCAGTLATFAPSAPLHAGTGYTVTVTTAVKDLAGNAMAMPLTWSFTTEGPPAAPAAPTVGNGLRAVTVTWSPVARATSYDLYYASTAGAASSVGAHVVNVSSPYTIRGLSPDRTPWYVAVVARNTYGDSAASPEGSGRADVGVHYDTVVPGTTLRRVVAALFSGYFAVGEYGIISSSSDGVNWTDRFAGVNATLNGLVGTGNRFVAVGSGGAAASSSDSVTWTPRATGVTTTLNDVATGPSGFVAVGAGGTIVTSTNGTSWVTRASGIVNDLVSVMWDGNQYMAWAPSVLVTSPDGITWTWASTTLGTLSRVVHSGNLYVATSATGSESGILTSSDGVNWTRRLASPFGFWDVAAAPDGRLVAMGDGGLVAASPDGVTWTLGVTPTSAGLFGLAFNEVIVNGLGRWAAVGHRGVILTSDDGIAWTERRPGTAPYVRALARSGSTRVAVGTHGKVLSSTDGIGWRPRASRVADTLNAVAAGGGGFMAAGGNTVVTSPDGLTWTPRPAAGGAVNGLTHSDAGGGLWVAVGSSGYVGTSPDGAAWTTQASGTTAKLNAVATWPAGLIAVGDAGTILTSVDAVTWTPQASGTAYHLTAVTSGGALLVAVTGAGTVLTSTNGSSWSAATTPLTGGSLAGVAWTGTGFVAVGTTRQAFSNPGLVWTSPDGLAWTDRHQPHRGALTSILWDETGLLAGNAGTPNYTFYSGGVLASADGATWTPRLGRRSGIGGAYWTGALFVAPDEWGDGIHTSPDGLTWSSRLSGQPSLNSFASSGTIVVGVGNFGAVATSRDGIAWTWQATPTSEHLSQVTWSGTTFAALGYSSGLVYLSTDGVSWVPAAIGTTSPWILSSAGGLLLVTAQDASTGEWVLIGSADGLTWTERHRAAGAYVDQVFEAGGRLVALEDGWNSFTTTILTSPDGVTWTPQASPSSVYVYGVTAVGTGWVGVTNDGTRAFPASSVDGVTWVPEYGTSFAAINSLAWNGTRVVASLGAVLTSP